jgi:hypothetical protein
MYGITKMLQLITMVYLGIAIIGTSGGISILNNSINLFGSHVGYASNPSGGVAANIYITSSAGGIDVRNNLLSNSYDNSSSTGDKSYTIYSTVANTVFTNIDNNNYYVSGPTGVLGYIGTDRINLVDYTTGFGGNVNSRVSAPVYTSTTDLHIPAGTKSAFRIWRCCYCISNYRYRWGCSSWSSRIYLWWRSSSRYRSR